MKSLGYLKVVEHVVRGRLHLRKRWSQRCNYTYRGSTMGRTLCFVIGPPSSGKTSFARWLENNHFFTRFSSDDFRTEEERSKGIYQPAFSRIEEAIKTTTTNVVYDAQSLYWKNRAERLRNWSTGFDKTMAMVMIRGLKSCITTEHFRTDRRSGGHRDAVITMIKQAYVGYNPFLSKGWWGYLNQEPWTEIWEVRWVPENIGKYHFTQRR